MSADKSQTEKNGLVSLELLDQSKREGTRLFLVNATEAERKAWHEHRDTKRGMKGKVLVPNAGMKRK